MLKFEAELKIIANKQNKARTAVEQAAGIGAMFKIIKKMIKCLPSATACNSHLYALIESVLADMEQKSSPNDSQVVILPAHKKKHS